MFGMPLDSLTPDERLMFHIGQVCQTHVWLDDTLRAAYRFLQAPGELAKANRLQSTTDLVAACRRELAVADLPADVKDAAGTALDAALSANDDRNRVVHDLWLQRLSEEGAPPEDDGPRWHLHRRDRRGLAGVLPSRPADLDYVEQTRDALTRARLRVWALSAALTETLPYWRDLVEGGVFASDREFWLPVMLNRFVQEDDGGVRPLPG